MNIYTQYIRQDFMYEKVGMSIDTLKQEANISTKSNIHKEAP